MGVTPESAAVGRVPAAATEATDAAPARMSDQAQQVAGAGLWHPIGTSGHSPGAGAIAAPVPVPVRQPGAAALARAGASSRSYSGGIYGQRGPASRV